MNNYIFETNEFGISEHGIHLLRSRFNYKTFTFKEVDLIELEKGRLVNNWIVILTAGIGLIAFGIFYTIRLFIVLNDPDVYRIYIEEIVVPVFPFFLGCYCVLIAVKTGPVMKLIKDGKKVILPLIEIKRSDHLSELVSFLNSIHGVKSKLRVDLKEI